MYASEEPLVGGGLLHVTGGPVPPPPPPPLRSSITMQSYLSRTMEAAYAVPPPQLHPLPYGPHVVVDAPYEMAGLSDFAAIGQRHAQHASDSDEMQLAPLQLTHQDNHSEQQAQALDASRHQDLPGLDPYQEYFQPPPPAMTLTSTPSLPPLSTHRGFLSSGASLATYEAMAALQQEPRVASTAFGVASTSFHDFSSSRLSSVDPNDYYFVASSSGAGATSSHQFARYHDLPPPLATAPPPPPLIPAHQHYQPSPSVLSHIRCVMESICEWMQFTDVTLVTNNERLRAHRTILASHSSFLRQLMLENVLDLGEADEPVFIMKEMSSGHMRLMMQFFYTGEVNLNSQEDIEPLKEACAMLGVSSLMARLEEFSYSLQCLPESYQEVEAEDNANASGGHVIISDDVEAKSAGAEHEPTYESCAYSSAAAKNRGIPPEVCRRIESVEDNQVDDVRVDTPPSPHANDQEASAEQDSYSAQKASSAFFSCTLCPSARFTSGDALKAHLRVHEGKKPWPCEICGVNTSSKSHLEVHMRKHSGVKPFSCGVCKKQFADKSAFRRHEATHSQDKKLFECSVCKKEYTDRSTCKRHESEKHGIGKVKKCPDCGKEFSRNEALATHLVKFHGASASKSDREMRPQVEDKKWAGGAKCPHCDMVFSKASSLAIHVRTHTGEKPFVCETCGKRFARSNNLALHTRTHTGEKRYVCKASADCDKSFSDVSALKRHTRTHTGEKPYSCAKCSKSFVQLGTKRGHEKNCKGRPTYDACDDTTTTNTLLKSVQEQKKRMVAMSSSAYAQENTNTEFAVSSMLEDNSLSVMAGSEPPGLNTDTLDSVRASCL